MPGATAIARCAAVRKRCGCPCLSDAILCSAFDAISTMRCALALSGCRQPDNKNRTGEWGMATSSRWKRRPQGSTWGDFAADDQLGRQNLLTPAKIKHVVVEAGDGIALRLSPLLDEPGAKAFNPRRVLPVRRPALRNGKPNMSHVVARDDTLVIDSGCAGVRWGLQRCAI